jgi:VIT1/CCC1 family predicted Fe2+/Mn2+ transporter
MTIWSMIMTSVLYFIGGIVGLVSFKFKRQGWAFVVLFTFLGAFSGFLYGVVIGMHYL